MRAKHFGGLPVVENGKVVGIMTQKDVNTTDPKKRDKMKVQDDDERAVTGLSEGYCRNCS